VNNNDIAERIASRHMLAMAKRMEDQAAERPVGTCANHGDQAESAAMTLYALHHVIHGRPRLHDVMTRALPIWGTLLCLAAGGCYGSVWAVAKIAGFASP